MQSDDGRRSHGSRGSGSTDRARRAAPAGLSPRPGDQLGGFRLLDRIGEGGSSLVFDAVEVSSGTSYALKVLLNPNELGIDRLKRGFRALADFYHPNLVSLDRLHFASLVREPSSPPEAGFWFITMERIHGSDLVSFAHQQRSAEDDFQWLAKLIRQIGAALSALHARSLVHRDIKPSNFMIDSSGRLRLLDYGLLGSFEPWFAAEPESNYVAGTLPYMAPEVLAQRTYPPASDIYSVGRVVLALLCGELPATDREAGEDPQEWERQNGGRLPRELPPELRELCAAMLEFDPLERPTAWDLERFGQQDAERGALPAWVRNHPLPLIGREAEMATVHRWIQDVVRGRGGAMHLSGPSGIGKTVLLGEVVQAARSEWIEVYRSRCRQREALPLRAFDEAINGIARWIASGGCGPLRLSQATRRSVADLFPVLAPALLAGAEPEPTVPPPSDWSSTELLVTEPLEGLSDQALRRQEALEAVVRLFAALCEQTPMLLVIDDLQWADGDSIALLRRLLSNPPRRLGILTASRPEFAARDLPLDQRIELSGVSPAAAQAIICNRARRRGVELPEPRVRELAKAAEGNPYLLTHIGDLLGADGAQTTDFGSLWALRRRRLTPLARLMLELLAVAGKPVDVGHLLAIAQAAAAGELVPDKPLSPDDSDATGTPAPGFEGGGFEGGGLASEDFAADPAAASLPAAALAELRHEMLARDYGPEAETVEMYHDRISDVVLRTAGPRTCRGHHRRWARWLAKQADLSSAELARHWIAGGRTAAAVEPAIRAAEAARERLAFADAARWYAWAAEHVEEVSATWPRSSEASSARSELPSAIELLQRAADCYAHCGRSGRAAGLFERLAEQSSGDDELRFRRFAAEHYICSGELAEARRTIAEVAPRLKLPRFHSPLRTKLEILWNLSRLRLLGPIDPAAEGRSVDPRQFERIDTQLNLCRAMSMFDSLYTGSLITSGMLLAARHGDRPRMLHASVAFAVISSYDAGRGREQANRLIPRILQTAEQLGDRKLIADGLSAAGAVHFTQGRWAEALEPLLTAHRIYRTECSGCIFESVHLHWQAVWAQFFLGRIPEMVRTRDWIQQDALDRDDSLAWLTSVCGNSVAGGLAADRVAEFRAADRRFRAHYRGLGFQLIHMLRLISATMLDCYSGRLEAAWRRLQAHERAYRRSAFSRLQIIRVHWQWMHLHTATCLAATSLAAIPPPAASPPAASPPAASPPAASPPVERWVREAEKWLRQLRREPMEFAATLSEFAAGQLAELRGDPGTARAAYQAASRSAARQQLELHRLAAEDRLAALAAEPASEGSSQPRLEAYLAAQGVHAPAAFARLLAAPLPPGRLR
ncbi:serine/threonine-protein kinase [Candidatus Laterigemmans baculatus]|uniref:serine/threonine-protein kinase n=1 Tax=Candidatus Laterigemmans baculatus TaxID=2770505 RepID=UPI0013D8F7FB|nr:serine/threonine-protein kinase [Candidatus Laterigemmans baculatus]